VTRWHLLKHTLAAAMFFGLMLTPRLWMNARAYPRVPVWNGLPELPLQWDWLPLGILLTALAPFLLMSSRARWHLVVFIILAALWSLWDQTRWQPWFYQYLFMMAALALGPPADDPERGQASLNACRLIVAATYFWSGLQKVNYLFATSTYPWLLEPILPYLPESWHGSVSASGWAAAAFECAIGLGLLVWPLRPVAVVGALLMHVTILFCLGPWGHDWNTIVWPWNVAMMAFVLILFARTRPVQPRDILWPRRFPFARVTLMLFGVMPLFNFFECWDSYLSAALYSGNTPNARIFVSQEVFDRLPPDVRPHAQPDWASEAGPDADGFYEVNTFNWAMAEMNVPGYPAERVARGVARRLAELPGPPARAGTDPGPRVIVLLEGRANWQTGQRTVTRVVIPE
jgi:uncharacterized membrane protein YphA (DoxX/SURF4 family)